MKNIYILAVAAIILSLGSCTIEKRHYQSGYHVEWNHRDKAIDKAEEVKITSPEQESTAAAEIQGGTEISTVVVPTDSPSTSVQNVEETTTALNEEPIFKKQSTTQKLTERAEVKSNNQVEVAENENAQASNTQNTSGESKEVSDILLVILCIFIPPLAVYLYESDVTTNFWVDLLLSFLFWVPGIIFAFLVCFAGVSL